VEFLNRPRSWVVIGVLIAGALLLQQLWHWEVERVEVPPGEFLVRISLWGQNLPEGEILAPDESHKGVMRDVLPEGRHFLNPLFWRYERHKMIDVPPGQCLVLTRKFGSPIPADRLARGEYLAGEGERGIVPEVRLPGKHRINPYAYDHALYNAVEIRADQVGVRTLKWGKDPRTLKVDPGQSVYVVPEGYRGVQERPVAPGTYYLNPFVEEIVPVETRTHRVEFKDIWFPSKDGFRLQPHVLVTYKVQAAKAPELFVMLTDKGKLDQADATEQEQQQNEILQKVLLPLIRGYVRIEGSKFAARDFVAQKAAAPPDGKEAPGLVQPAAKGVNAREKLQHEVMEKVIPECQKLGLVVESVTLAQMDATEDLGELAGLIADREQMRLVRETNQQLIEQYKTDQETKAKDMLNEQKTEMVRAKTKLDVETKKAEQRKEVEELKLKQELDSARIRLEAARNEARATVTLAKAEAAVITSQNEAEVAGLRTAVQGFPSAQHFAQYHVLAKLAPALTEIFASDNSDFAKLFATYLTPDSKPPATVRMPPAPDSKTAKAEGGSNGR
jgi:hypothetical protein